MSRGKVLVVDDDAAMLRMVERILSDSYEVRSVLRSEEALGPAREFQPDVAILDIQMPGLDGFELLAKLKHDVPGVDVLFMTGSVYELNARLIRAIREKAFYFIQKPFDREVLLTLLERCFELRRLARDNAQYLSRLEAELEEARRFQLGLLPLPEARVGGFQVAARYRPSTELGGDFFDYAATEDGGLALLLADVSGHGVSAAMLTGIVKAAFHDAAEEDFEPRSVVQRISGGIRTFGEDRLITAFAARLVGTTLEYVNAGHEPALVRAPAGDLEELRLTGPLISPAFPETSWELGRRELSAGERLLLYTDGVTEARGESERYGDARLRQEFSATRASGGKLLDHLLDQLESFAQGRPFEDDLTLLAVEAPKSPAAPKPRPAGC